MNAHYMFSPLSTPESGRTLTLEEPGHCTNASNDDLNATTAASKIITASFAMLFYVVVFVLSVFGACCPSWRKLLSMQATYVLFLVGALVVSVNIFTNENDSYIEDYYRIASGSLVGIIYVVVGGIVFFKKPPSCTVACRPVANQPCVQHCHENVATLSRQQPSMGSVVGGITSLLVVIELLLLACTRKAKSLASEDQLKAWSCHLVDETIFLVQKIIQVVMYVWLRQRVPSDRFMVNASFYFKLLSFFNFVLWLDSVINTDHDLEFTKAERTFGSAFTVIETVYKALLIDYRLLCSLLFLEHALEISEDEISDTETRENSPAEEQLTGNAHLVMINDMTPSDQQKRSMGYAVGLTCLIVQVVCLANYLPKLDIGPWVHVFAILVYTLLAVCGVVLLIKNDLQVRHKSDKESNGIKIMVCCMGVVGFTCWIIKASLSTFWATIGSRGDVNDTYFSWAAAKLAVRGIGSLFLMVIFAKVNVHVITRRNPTVKINYFLVPAMMLGILSEFVSSVIDQAAGPVDKRLSCEVKESSLTILLEAGPAMYLGFCIHLFLQFVIIQTRMGRARVVQEVSCNQALETTPLLVRRKSDDTMTVSRASSRTI